MVREFRAKAGQPATLRITGLGLYDAYLNGHPVCDHRLEPGWTDPTKRLHVRSHDVSDLIRDGANVLEVMLADGWAVGHVAQKRRQVWRDRPALWAELDLGGEKLATGPDWSCRRTGILEADLLMGESYDATMEESELLPVLVVDPPAGRLVEYDGPPVRATQEVLPIGVVEKGTWNGKRLLFDLGQVITGVVRARVVGGKGAHVSLRHAEVLDAKGELYTANLRTARAEDHWTLGADGQQEWEPRFTFHGFRYVELSGEFESAEVVGIVLGTDLLESGGFECSDPVICQLWSNIDWGFRGNALSIPTDCPQRDERLGWTGDALAFMPTAFWLRDCREFLAKWLEDLTDAQREDGSVPPVAPDPGIGLDDGGPAWADAIVFCLHQHWRQYGDLDTVRRMAPAARRWLDRELAQAPDFIRCHPGRAGWKGFGDWVSINAETPHDLIGTAFLAESCRLMADLDEALGEKGPYREARESAVAAFQRRFLTSDGILASPSQTSHVLALAFDLVPTELRPKLVQALADDIGRRGWKLSTGFIGTPLLMSVLSENGRHDAACRLLAQEDWPGWRFPIRHGATTIWERWDGWTPEKGFQDPGMNSFNHYAFGSVGRWLCETAAGLRLTEPGGSGLRFAPQVVPGWEHCRAWQRLAGGVASASWEVVDGHFHFFVQVPAGSHAVVSLPPGEVTEEPFPPGLDGLYQAGPGSYDFAVWLEPGPEGLGP